MSFARLSKKLSKLAPPISLAPLPPSSPARKIAWSRESRPPQTLARNWQEASGSAGETRFRDLVARLQILLPSDWSSHQENELDEQTGAPLIAWRADEPGAKYDVRVYVSAEAVALHITARK